MKPANTPDSVRSWLPKGVTVIPLGWELPRQLDAAYPHTQRAASTCAYLALLRAEIARFTQTELARLCCSDPHLAVESR